MNAVKHKEGKERKGQKKKIDHLHHNVISSLELHITEYQLLLKQDKFLPRSSERRHYFYG